MKLLINIIILIIFLYDQKFFIFINCQKPSKDEKINVFYMAPFLSGGGYSSESLTIASSLYIHHSNSINLQIFHHADNIDEKFIKSLSNNMKKNVNEMWKDKGFYPMKVIKKNVIVLCHSEPGSWFEPLYKTLECPIDEKRFGGISGKEKIIKIGRSMFETDRIPDGWSKRLNRMDEVWVPTSFHVKTFEKYGVEKKKLKVLPEPIDTDVFNPDVKPLIKKESENETIFISVFKLEERKGWKILLKAYLTEFDPSVDKTRLIMLISTYHLKKPVKSIISDYIKENIMIDVKGELPKYTIMSNLSDEAMASFYKSGDAFCLPTKGEGWGRPFVEAMSTGIPCIATNWSGQTEYMSNNNSFLIDYDLVEVDKSLPWNGHFWAQARIEHLKSIMRFVHENHSDVKKRGLEARKTMEEQYSMKIISDIFSDNFKRVIKEHEIRLNEKQIENTDEL